MASTRFPIRNNRNPQRVVKADENAAGRHVRQTSGIPAFGAPSRVTMKDSIVKMIQPRTALGEVNTFAANRRENSARVVLGKGKEEIGTKRSRPDSDGTLAQRIPLGPNQAIAPSTNVPRVSTLVQPIRTTALISGRRLPKIDVAPSEQHDSAWPAVDPRDVDMDVVEDVVQQIDERIGVVRRDSGDSGFDEYDSMIGVEDTSVEEKHHDAVISDSVIRVWPEITPARALRYERDVQAIREVYPNDESEDDRDPAMVTEYADEIFEYMSELEVEMMPSADYMDRQPDMTWDMRVNVVDWLQKIHVRYHLLPETLWIAINIMDRFLTLRTVSKVKLQLVGVTSMFIASKYEEIMAPSLQEFALMTDNTYTKDEILRGERIILQALEFRVSHYCTPYTWMRKISKSDDYDIQTRTLSKFLTELTLLDERFLRVKPNMVAAVGMYTARVMLGGDWNEHFVFYSGYNEHQLAPGHQYLVQKLLEPYFPKLTVAKKYAHKKFLRASVFALSWAQAQQGGDVVEVAMLGEHDLYR